MGIAAWLFIDYVSLLKTRICMQVLSSNDEQVEPNPLKIITVLLADVVGTAMLYVVGSIVLLVFMLPNLLAASAASIWLWLYALSGIFIQLLVRFDLGFQWFNRKFDIEKKPLQAIGLVAGALVATVYWIFALTAHLLHA